MKETLNLLFITKKKLIKTKDECLFSTLTDTFQDKSNWVIDNGAYRHLNGHHKKMKTLSKGKYYSVKLRDNKSYFVRGLWSTYIEFENGSNIHLNNILFVLSLHKNLISILCLEDKSDRVDFIDGKVVVWSNNSSIENARVTGILEGRIYRLLSPLAQALVHIEINPCELWNRIFGHLHF